MQLITPIPSTCKYKAFKVVPDYKVQQDLQVDHRVHRVQQVLKGSKVTWVIRDSKDTETRVCRVRMEYKVSKGIMAFKEYKVIKGMKERLEYKVFKDIKAISDIRDSRVFMDHKV